MNNPIQSMMDGLGQQMQKARAESQMTLGKMIDRMRELPQDLGIELGTPHSYRGYYDDLAFNPTKETRTVADILHDAKGAMGEVFHGYKGGEYQMGRNTPVWGANYGECGRMLIAINDDGTLAMEEDE